MGVLGAAEEIDERPHHREERRLLAAQLLRKRLFGGSHCSVHRTRVRLQGLNGIAGPQRRSHGGNEHRTAFIARPHLETASASR